MGQDIVNFRIFCVQTSSNLVKAPFRQILFPQRGDSTTRQISYYVNNHQTQLIFGKYLKTLLILSKNPSRRNYRISSKSRRTRIEIYAREVEFAISIASMTALLQLGGVVAQPGKERKRAVAAKGKPSKSKLRKEDILFAVANYLRALMAELEEVKASVAKDVQVTATPIIITIIKVFLGELYFVLQEHETLSCLHA